MNSIDVINITAFALKAITTKAEGINAWPLQELLKGRISIPFESIRPLGSNVGGWGFNMDFYNKATISDTKTEKMLKECKDSRKYYELKNRIIFNLMKYTVIKKSIEKLQDKLSKYRILKFQNKKEKKISPYVADEISDYLLRIQPFFKKGNLDKLFPTPENLLHGSYYAKENYNKLLSQFIPAVTKAVGARMVGKNMEINFDLNTNIKKFRPNGWPDERMNDRNKKKRWLHSDMKNVSYLYVYKLFDKYVELGGLDENKNIDLLDNN